MSYNQVGACPHCGAPIYSPGAWWGIMPPPVTYSCYCAGQPAAIVTSNFEFWVKPKEIGIDLKNRSFADLEKQIDELKATVEMQHTLLDVQIGLTESARRTCEELRDVILGLKTRSSIYFPFRLEWEKEVSICKESK